MNVRVQTHTERYVEADGFKVTEVGNSYRVGSGWSAMTLTRAEAAWLRDALCALLGIAHE